MRCVRFSSKAIIVCSREDEEFDCKNNYRCGKLAKFWLENIEKFNCRMLVVFVVIYLIKMKIKKDPIGLKAFKIVCPIIMQLVVNSYQCLYLFY